MANNAAEHRRTGEQAAPKVVGFPEVPTARCRGTAMAMGAVPTKQAARTGTVKGRLLGCRCYPVFFLPSGNLT